MSTQSTILITGSSTGIGRACALEFARRGWLVFAGVRRAADGESLRAEGGENIVPLQLEVTDPAQIASAMEQVRARVGHLNALVNNAGISVPSPLELLPLEDLRLQLEINVTAVLAVTQAALPLLRAAPGLRTIVMVSSSSGRRAMPVVGAYSASKFALEALCDALRIELVPWRIRVVSLQPGPVESAIWDKTVAASDERMARMDPDGLRRYRPMILFVRARVLGQRMLPAQRLADETWKIVTGRRPPARVFVTPMRTLNLVAESLPTRWKDWLIVKLMPKWGDEE